MTARVDAAVEHLGRWAARRTTRRSFLHRIGQLAVFVAAGPTIAGLLIREAQARVCGQSGVTPKCSTFDCNGPGDVWGWCWYASDGCCRNGGLKKICDCCTVNYPNVHGYCPSGTNVRCIVESCGTDPRLQTVDLTPIRWEAGGGYYHHATRAGHGLANRAVVTDGTSLWAQCIAAPLAGALGVPVLAVGPSGPSGDDVALLGALGVTEVMVVGTPTGLAAFGGAGMTLDQVTSTTDPGLMSQQVAARIGAVNDINRTVTIETAGLSAAAAPVAASLAALGGFPLVVTAGSAQAVGLPTFYVGPEPADVGLPNDRTTATSLVELSLEVADYASALPTVTPGRLALAPSGSSDVVGLVNLGVPLVLHPDAVLGPVEGWLQEHSLRFGRLVEVYHVQGPGQLATSEYWKLQAAVNGYRVDQLTGVAGEGLPVIRQPFAERPIGLARADGAFDFGSVEPPTYWTSQGHTFRR